MEKGNRDLYGKIKERSIPYISRNTNVLELACGSGQLSFRLARYAKLWEASLKRPKSELQSLTNSICVFTRTTYRESCLTIPLLKCLSFTRASKKKALAERIRAELDKDKEQNDGIEKFIAKVKAITDIQELTPEIVREFISRIDVYAPYRENKQRHQRIEIYYHGVGYGFIPEPEEVEEMFQEHLRDRKQYTKEKTA